MSPVVKMDSLVLLLSAAVLLCSQAHGIRYSNCGSVKGTVTDVHVTGCDNLPVCPLKRGTSPTISIAFTSKEDSSVLRAVVHGVIHDVPLPFPLPQANACENCGISCPLHNGGSYNYAQTLPVKDSYPTLDVTVKWELKDANGVDVVCVLIPAKVV